MPNVILYKREVHFNLISLRVETPSRQNIKANKKQNRPPFLRFVKLHSFVSPSFSPLFCPVVVVVCFLFILEGKSYVNIFELLACLQSN